MHYEVELKQKAVKFLKSIPKSEKEKIEHSLLDLSKNPRNENVIKIHPKHLDNYRARCGNYRIFFTIQDKRLVIEVIDIKDRKDAYNKK